MSAKLPLIGHERFLIDALTKALHDAARGHADYSPITEDQRGAHFEVRLANGRIAKVTIELDRIEQEVREP